MTPDLPHALVRPFVLLVATLASLAASAPSGTAPAAALPGEILDLSRWKLTLPIDTDRPGGPDEVRPPDLAAFSDRTCFFVDPARRAVIFRARCGGNTTRGSRYPRCELREMEAGGRAEVSWSTDDGDAVRTMILRAAVTATPRVKPHVVLAQIHDDEDDVLMVRLEGAKLFIEREGQADVVLTPRHALGTPFTLRIAAGGGRVRAWFDGREALDWAVSRKGCYFKAGCYTQSNVRAGDDADAFGEVAIYELSVGAADARAR